MKSSILLTVAVVALTIVIIVVVTVTLILSSEIRFAPDYNGFIQNNIEKRNIKKFLRILTEHPRPAGSSFVDQVASSISKTWRESGFDEVQKIRYKIKVPRPNVTNPNAVRILNSYGQVIFVSHHTQPPLDEGSSADEDLLDAFSPFAPKGEVKGLPVYANYGLQTDYDYLEEIGVSVKDQIVILRNGISYPGDKIRLASMKEAAGVLLYSDPSDVAPGNGINTYPEGPDCPPEAIRVQPLKIYTKECGTTSEDAASCFVDIPVQPISYADAYQILRRMAGEAAHDSFQGGFNFTYHIGPGFEGGGELEITSSNFLDEVDANDVIGIIWGEYEPDRYVVVGAHHDALFYGAMDPGSGCAVQIELARIFGEMVLTKDWRPRRTMVFINWGASEDGLISSYKFTTDFFTKLRTRAVAYLDLNFVASGTKRFLSSASPILFTSIEEVTKMVEGVLNEGSIYDFWTGFDASNDERPQHFGLSGTENFASFIYDLGIPSASVNFVENENWKFLPTYKTAYDTFNLVENYLDEDMAYHQTIANIYGLLAWKIANDHIIPFSLEDLVAHMSTSFNNLYTEEHDALEYFDVNIGRLNASINTFASSVIDFQNLASVINFNRDLLLRAMNDALCEVMKAFLSSNGVPGQPSYKYILTSPQLGNLYRTEDFPGIRNILKSVTVTNEDTVRKELNQHIDELSDRILEAADILSWNFW